MGNVILKDDQKIREFIVVSYRMLKGDLQAGKGEYLDSLLEMLKIATADKDEAVRKLRSLSEVYTNIPEFADRTLDLRPKN